MEIIKPPTWVSSTSSVRGMSRMDFTPAHTTATGVRPSSVRSADTSMLASPPRCTPPMPARPSQRGFVLFMIGARIWHEAGSLLRCLAIEATLSGDSSLEVSLIYPPRALCMVSTQVPG